MTMKKQQQQQQNSWLQCTVKDIMIIYSLNESSGFEGVWECLMCLYVVGSGYKIYNIYWFESVVELLLFFCE